MKAARFMHGALRAAHGAAACGLVALVFCHCGALDAAELETPVAAPGIESAFDSRIIRIDATSPEVSWTYVNHWDFPLVVERFEESCTCLRGMAAEDPVEPGKSGVIRAIFTAGPHRGIVRKSLHVRFVAHEKPVELIAEAHIPSSVSLSARDLVWPVGEGGARTIDLTAGGEADFRITDLRGLAPAEFAVRSETLVEGRHYRLTITPGPSAPVSATRCLQIRTDSPDPRDRVLAVFLRTGAPPAAAGPSTDTSHPAPAAFHPATGL
jgi:hypothetical protein